MTESCTRRFLRKTAKYSHGKKGKSRDNKPRIRLMIVAEYAHIFKVYSPYSYHQIRRLPLTTPPLFKIYNPKLA